MLIDVTSRSRAELRAEGRPEELVCGLVCW